MKEYSFTAVLHEDRDSGGAYVIFPWDLRREFGKGRVRVHALFGGIPYEGSIVTTLFRSSIVNMGVTDAEGNICYVIGVLKSIRTRLGIAEGDPMDVVITVE